MKAIIPVAGAGTKLRPHTYTQPKALIPLAGKTVLSIIVDQLVEAGIKDFIFIIGYMGEKIKDYVNANYPHLQTDFITQTTRQGTGHAIEITQILAGEEELLIVFGDTIAEYDIKAVLASPYSMLGVKKVDDPRNFGVVEINDEGKIIRVVEKPAIPKSNLALVGIYKIKETALLYDCLIDIHNNQIKSYDEFSLTDAIECMIRKDIRFDYFKVQSWFDCGRKESLLESNAILLKKFGGKIVPNNIVDNSIIIPPVSIGENCTIVNSVVGPYVAIGDNCIVNKTIVRDSIVGSYSRLEELVLANSLIGSDAEIKGVTQNLNIGDNTSIDLTGHK